MISKTFKWVSVRVFFGGFHVGFQFRRHVSKNIYIKKNSTYQKIYMHLKKLARIKKYMCIKKNPDATV